MPSVWVQLLRIERILEAGRERAYYPGDWVEVHPRLAMRLVEKGAGRVLGREIQKLLPGCGIVARDRPEWGRKHLAGQYEMVAGEIRVAFPHTLIWHTDLHPRRELLPAGFNLLENWDAACPLLSYETLALHVGSQEERAATKKAIRDLRVPLYETRLLFVKRCAAGIALVEAWNRERENGGDERLAFLRAFYAMKPKLCALPVSWHDKNV